MNYPKRQERLRGLLAASACDAVLIEHPAHLFYLTGLELSSGKLLISLQQSCLLVDGRYFETASKQTLYPVLLIKEGILKEQIVSFDIHKLSFDQLQTTYLAFLGLTQLAEELNSHSHPLTIVAAESPVQQLRLIKDEEEIACLKQAAKLGCEGYAFILSLLKEGISEEELAFELEFFWKKRERKS